MLYLRKVSDLGDLWYREFYLEMSKRIQFPIDNSFPWILASHVLTSKKPPKETAPIDMVLYPLSLYNDAGYTALFKLRNQFLFDECEAEVNLVFDQLVFIVSESIYAHYKNSASALQMDKPYKRRMEQLLRTKTRFHVARSRYETFLNQRHFHILGRTLNINHLVAQRINGYLRQSLETIISRFETQSLTYILEFESQLYNLRLTHSLLEAGLEVDTWDVIFNDINESTNLGSISGRILFHSIIELINDILPDFCYNHVTQRFIRGPVAMHEPSQHADPGRAMNYHLYGTKSMNVAYGKIADMRKGFFGPPHVQALIRVLGTQNMPILVHECLGHIELKINNVLTPYISALLAGMPQKTKLPIYDYGTMGNFGNFELKLQEIMMYPS